MSREAHVRICGGLGLKCPGLPGGESDDWVHGTPGAWLEAMHAWLTAPRADDHADAFPANLEPPSWKTFAFILSASRFYE